MITISIGVTAYLFSKSGLVWEGAGAAALLAMILDAVLISLWISTR